MAGEINLQRLVALEIVTQLEKGNLNSDLSIAFNEIKKDLVFNNVKKIYKREPQPSFQTIKHNLSAIYKIWKDSDFSDQAIEDSQSFLRDICNKKLKDKITQKDYEDFLKLQ